MIIVSQDKTETTESLELQIDCITEENGDFPINKTEIIGYCIANKKNHTILATYKTEERAKEVLQEIVKLYKATECLKVSINRISDKVGAIGIENGFVYEMPED